MKSWTHFSSRWPTLDIRVAMELNSRDGLRNLSAWSSSIREENEQVPPHSIVPPVNRDTQALEKLLVPGKNGSHWARVAAIGLALAGLEISTRIERELQSDSGSAFWARRLAWALITGADM